MHELFLGLVVEVVKQGSCGYFAGPLELAFELTLDVLEFALGVRKVFGTVVQHKINKHNKKH